MIYCLYGENDYEINRFINNILSDNKIEDKITYDYTSTNIEDIITDALYNDLFSSKKLIVVNDAHFLTTKSTLESDLLVKYKNNPNPNTFLVFKVLNEKLDERKKIVKLLKDKVVVKEFKLLDDKNMSFFINNYFKELNYKINYDAVNEIVNRLKSNPSVIYNELEKLMLYKINEKVITLEDVKRCTTKYKENEIFDLIDAVINNNKGKIFKLFKSLIDDREEAVVIITLIANQLRLILQSKILINEGKSQNEIASLLKEHPYRISLAIDSSYKITNEKLESLLMSLATLDKKIKTGEVDKNQGLETFFLEI